MEQFKRSGHTIKYLSDEERNEVKKYFLFLERGACRIYPEDLLLPSIFAENADEVTNRQLRPTDVFIQGYLKTGTTWTQEIVWTMLHNPDLNSPKGSQELFYRSPIFEMDIFATIHDYKKDPNMYQSLKDTYPHINFEDSFNWAKVLEATPDSRVMKCHLPPSFFPKKMLESTKIIYLIRDPRDVCVSFYYHSKFFDTFRYQGTIEEFADAFMNNKLICGDMANHIRKWLPYKDQKNVHFIFYEDLKVNTMLELKKLDRFLGSNLTDEQLEKVNHHVSFRQMKKQATVLNRDDEENPSGFYVKTDDEAEDVGFYRKGIVGDYKNKFSPELQQKFEVYMKKAFDGMNMPYC